MVAAGDPFFLIFDKPDIERDGVEFGRVAELLHAFEGLCGEAARFRSSQTPGMQAIQGLTRPFILSLRADTTIGSIKLAMWGLLAVETLQLAANASQASGYTLKDAIEAVRTAKGEQVDDDPIARSFAEGPGKQQVRAVFSAAAKVGCTYVSIQRGNEEVVLFSEQEGARLLIAGRSQGGIAAVQAGSAPPSISGPITITTDVSYRGRKYKAFLASDDGSFYDPGKARLTMPGKGQFIVLWGSELPLPTVDNLGIRSEEVEPDLVTHASDLPPGFARAEKVILVTGASPLNFR